MKVHTFDDDCLQNNQTNIITENHSQFFFIYAYNEFVKRSNPA